MLFDKQLHSFSTYSSCLEGHLLFLNQVGVCPSTVYCIIALVCLIFGKTLHPLALPSFVLFVDIHPVLGRSLLFVSI